MKYEITYNDRRYELELTGENGSGYTVALIDADGRKTDRKIEVIGHGDNLVLISEKGTYDFDCWVEEEKVSCIYKGESYRFECLSERDKLRSSSKSQFEGKGQDISVKMPGRVVKVLVKPEESVKKGQGVLILEAMKMENKIIAPHDGIISEILVSEGSNVETGQTLVRYVD